MGKTRDTGFLNNCLLTDSSNNVGIGGAANASFKLQVTGATNLTGALTGTTGSFSGAVQGDFLVVGNTAATSGGLRLGTQVAIRARNVANSANIPLIESTATDAVAIASGGANVGIGTSSPLAKLQVSGTQTLPSLTSNTGIFTVNSTSTVQLNIGGNDSAPFPIWLQTRDTSGGTNSYPLLLNPLGGNVGIGTSSPGSKLDVFTGTGATFRVVFAGTNILNIGNYSSADGFRELNVAGSELAFFTGTAGAGSTTEKMRITSGGSVGIGGSTLSDFKLYIKSSTSDSNSYVITAFNSSESGMFYVRSNGQVYLPAYSNGTLSISTGGLITSSSDKNLKIDDGGIENALNKVLQLNPRYFYWKKESEIEDNNRQLGFYAQDVHDSLGQEVANNNGNGKWGIYDRGILAHLVKAIQEQQAQIEELTQKVNALENK
jgi:hypothetical protein